MPKMKTKRAIAKRFKITKNGKIKRFKAFKNHLKYHKSKQAKRDFRKGQIATKGDAKRIKVMIPYGGK
jgi:large subunit ribosomal protein L35